MLPCHTSITQHYIHAHTADPVVKAAFVWEDGSYKAKTFNFYIFPRPFEGSDKRFICQASSIAFLASCGFDFNKAIYDGVGYLTGECRAGDGRAAAASSAHTWLLQSPHKAFQVAALVLSNEIELCSRRWPKAPCSAC